MFLGKYALHIFLLVSLSKIFPPATDDIGTKYFRVLKTKSQGLTYASYGPGTYCQLHVHCTGGTGLRACGQFNFLA
jgi:hypothetical protein